MGFETKTWKDRQSEFPNRRTLTKEDQSTELVTVTRSEGIISEEGDAFSAENMNNLETRIKNAIGTGTIPEALGADIIAALNTLNTNLGNKFDKASLFTVSGYLNNTSANNAFNLNKAYSTPPYLLSAQIQLTSGVWSDMRTLTGITRIDNNNNQVNVIKETATTYANYMVRFVFLAT